MQLANPLSTKKLRPYWSWLYPVRSPQNLIFLLLLRFPWLHLYLHLVCHQFLASRILSIPAKRFVWTHRVQIRSKQDSKLRQLACNFPYCLSHVMPRMLVDMLIFECVLEQVSRSKWMPRFRNPVRRYLLSTAFPSESCKFHLFEQVQSVAFASIKFLLHRLRNPACSR